MKEPIKTEDALRIFGESSGLLLVSIKVGGLRAKASVPRADDVAKAAEDEGGGSKVSIPIYEVLDEDLNLKSAVDAIKNRRSKVLERYGISASSNDCYYVPSKNEAALAAEVEEMQAEAERIKEKYTDPSNWEKGFKTFVEAVERISGEADPFEQEVLLESGIAEKFPDPDDIAASVYVRIGRWERLTKLEDAMGDWESKLVKDRIAEILEARPSRFEAFSDKALKLLQVFDRAAATRREMTSDALAQKQGVISELDKFTDLEEAVGFDSRQGLGLLTLVCETVAFSYADKTPEEREGLVAQARSEVLNQLSNIPLEIRERWKAWADPRDEEELENLLEQISVCEDVEQKAKLKGRYTRARSIKSRQLKALKQYENKVMHDLDESTSLPNPSEVIVTEDGLAAPF